MLRAVSALVVVLYASAALAATPLLLYLFNEASSGTTPTTIHDTSVGPVGDLTITYGLAAAWTSVTAGDGLNYAFTGTSVSAALTSTKVQTALQGATKVYFETVVDAAGQASAYGNYFTIEDNSGDTVIGMIINHAQGGVILNWSNGAGIAKAVLPTSGVFHLRCEIDNTQAVGTDRAKFWINGPPVASGSVTWVATPALNLAIDTDGTTAVNWTQAKVKISGDVSGDVSSGITYFAAIYTASPGDNSTALLANNDANPNTSTPTINKGSLFFGAGGMTWNWSPVDVVTAYPAIPWRQRSATQAVLQ